MLGGGQLAHAACPGVDAHLRRIGLVEQLGVLGTRGVPRSPAGVMPWRRCRPRRPAGDSQRARPGLRLLFDEAVSPRGHLGSSTVRSSRRARDAEAQHVGVVRGGQQARGFRLRGAIVVLSLVSAHRRRSLCRCCSVCIASIATPRPPTCAACRRRRRAGRRRTGRGDRRGSGSRQPPARSAAPSSGVARRRRYSLMMPATRPSTRLDLYSRTLASLNCSNRRLLPST